MSNKGRHLTEIVKLSRDSTSKANMQNINPDDQSPDHWAIRKSFLPPIPELEEVADLLSEAVDAILRDDLPLAARLIVEADIEAVGQYAAQISGPISAVVHRYRDVGDPPIIKDRAKQRMPSSSTEREIFERDGWRCRVCDTRIISKKSIRKMHAILPDEARQGRRAIDCHYGMSAICVSLDHLLPHSRGGTNNPDNLVTACGPCQFGRNNWTFAEVGIEDPRGRAPIVDEWDGLTRIEALKV